MASIRTQIYLPLWLKEEIKKAAAAKRVNASEFIRDCLKREVQSQPSQNPPGN